MNNIPMELNLYWVKWTIEYVEVVSIIYFINKVSSKNRIIEVSTEQIKLYGQKK